MSEPARSLVGEPRWELAQRVAGSKVFSRSPALRRFLLFVCEAALRGQADEIKEQQIGYQVLGRPADYNAAEDNIVRVRARELRRKLEEYFSLEGKEEPMVILLPKGGYVPVFEPRIAAPAAADAGPAPARSSRLPWAVATLLAVACVALLLRDLRRSAGAPGASGGPVERFWSELVRPGEQTLVVAADSNFVIMQDIAGKSVALDDYLRQKYLSWPEFRNSPVASIASRQYTGIGEVHVLLRILRIRPEFPQRVRFRFARDLDLRDLKNGNVILMGARRANPWVELFEPRCRFVFRWDAARNRSYIEDRTPKPGDPAVFENQVNGNSVMSYATISFLPNLSENGRVLMIAGLNTEGTETAGDYVITPESCERLLRKIGAGSSGAIPPFEAVIRLYSVGGASSTSEIVNARLIE
jgi:hypothetical protein